MEKIGKISIRFFVNENVKALHKPFLGKSAFYPVYIQLTYGRKNTQFRSSHNGQYMSIDDAFVHAGDFLKYEETLIRQVVEYEIKSQKKKFQLKGLKDRYLVYTNDIAHHLDNYFRNALHNSWTEKDSKFWHLLDPTARYDVPLKLIFEASEKLIPNFGTLLPKNFKDEMLIGEEFIAWSDRSKERPCLILWLNDSLKEEYRLFLRKKGDSESKITDKINLIDIALELTEDLAVH